MTPGGRLAVLVPRGVAKHFVSAMATIEATAREQARARARLGQVPPRGDRGGTHRDDEARRARSDAGSRAHRRAGGDAAPRRHRGAARERAVHGAARATRTRTTRLRAAGSTPGRTSIDLAQPQGRAARAMLEPAPSLDTAFARTQIEAFQRNLRRGANVPGEGYEFYDVTAWSLPSSSASRRTGRKTLAPVTAAWVRAAELTSAGGVTGARTARSAYVFSSERNGAARLAYHLMATWIPRRRLGAADRGGRTDISRVARTSFASGATTRRCTRASNAWRARAASSCSA